jgi:hypothetical protein
VCERETEFASFLVVVIIMCTFVLFYAGLIMVAASNMEKSKVSRANVSRWEEMEWKCPPLDHVWKRQLNDIGFLASAADIARVMNTWRLDPDDYDAREIVKLIVKAHRSLVRLQQRNPAHGLLHALRLDDCPFWKELEARAKQV